MKTDIDTVDMVLTKYEVDPAIRTKVLRDIESEINAAKEDKAPKQKKQFVIVALTDDEKVTEVPMYVIQIPDMDSPHTVMDKVERAVRDYNTSKKGRKRPVTKVGEAFEVVTRKFFTEGKLNVNTKHPVFTVTASNNIEIKPDDQE